MLSVSLQTAQLTLPIESIQCRAYESCAAPLCPKDVNVGKCLWFADEPVCTSRKVPDWVRKQRRIARLPNTDPSKYFTLYMLNATRRISHGLRGADPNHADADRVWVARRVSQIGKRGMAQTGVAGPRSERQPEQAVWKHILSDTNQVAQYYE